MASGSVGSDTIAGPLAQPDTTAADCTLRNVRGTCSATLNGGPLMLEQSHPGVWAALIFFKPPGFPALRR
eukprot:3840973-Rhodomonas_salina.3